MIQSTFPVRQIGDFEITALSDGVLSARLDLLSGIENAAANEIQEHAGVAEPGDIHINGYLIRGRGRIILVDAGAGGVNNVGGDLITHLAAVGVVPDEVDTVLLTHCHPDHIGGLLDDEQRPVYQHADIFLHPLEAEHWWDDNTLNSADARTARNFRLVRQTLQACGQQVRFFDENCVAEGILPVWLPGHTPGHTGFLIHSHDKDLLIWGDIVHYPHIQSALPEVCIVFDADPAQAEATRKEVLERAVRENLLVAGMHIGPQGFARVLRVGSGYRLSYSG
ncbi:MBL fold metallo-hydrolase [Enterobacter cloacae]|uniref:MBL fold metallo-hydrolase n=1 Tax=Enterobacter cloacae TaxID=550 RepID=UPI00178857C0|nr:MBL fold metallo-hydrolase [Enterobacter cloacae]MBE1253427.1 MBL fold metallo-hydrolase [Enterobacter cloacae]